ncbi:uncharacterized protein LOC101454117 [Ceratitis capitata]|uniref:uncharacterized protein LOC101454117 n=1 Tax=Ceratitis capitata TaxID=7213 RepID=UPI000A0FF981|nr:uncharacterized protein LOC101454117 [Ceratitis capitata]
MPNRTRRREWRYSPSFSNCTPESLHLSHWCVVQHFYAERMWKKATLPLLLLLLLLTALLLAQLVATESTQPAANAEDIVTTSSSSTELFEATALDINDKDDHDDADEATVDTYDDDDEETSTASRTKETAPQLSIKTTLTSEDVDDEEGAEESIESDNGEGVREEQIVGEETNAPDVGSGVGDAECSGEGAVATDDISIGVDGEDSDETRREVSLSSLKQRVRDRLAFIMMREMTRMIDYALEQQRSVVNQFLQDETIEMVKCATMEAVKKSCVSFMADVRDALKMDKGKDFLTQLAQFGVKTLMARNFESFVEQHNTTRLKQPTAENVIIDNALRKAGVMQIEIEMQKRFMEFTQLFTTTVGDYMQTLKEEDERGDFDEKLLVWYRQFMTATNISNQVNVLCKFLPLYKSIFSIESDGD